MATGQDEKFNYHIEQTNERLKNIEQKLDLMINRWSLFWGGAMAVSAVVSFAITVLFGK